MKFQSQAFRASFHDTSAFDSGEPTLDTWLREHASGAQARRVATTFVWHEPENPRVLAYYSLTGHILERDKLPKSIGRGSPNEVPAVLLARLALDRTCHGQGHGGELLLDALARIVAATSQVAARFVVVDALHESAAGFYEHHGFRRIPHTLRLVLKISDAAATLRAADIDC